MPPQMTAAQADELFGLVRAAAMSKLLEPTLQPFADEIRRSANDVLHGTPCGEQDAFDLLIKTRKVLGSLYDQKK